MRKYQEAGTQALQRAIAILNSFSQDRTDLSLTDICKSLSLQKAMEVKEDLAYIPLFSPCPIGRKFPSKDSVKVGRLAVETNFFPLWEVVNSKFMMTYHNGFPLPVESYTRKIGKYGHLTREELREFQTIVDERYSRLLAMTTL